MTIDDPRVAWRIFSGAAELDIETSDPFGRMRFSDRVKQEVVNPVVSEFLFHNGFRPYYPLSRRFAVCISHDVDHLVQPGLPRYDRAKAAVKDLLTGQWKRTIRYLNPNDAINPSYNLEELMATENRLGVPSTFNFLSLSPGERDYNYALEEVRPLLKKITEHGFEIALHGGHDAYLNIGKLKQEKTALQREARVVVKGYRNHYLRFKAPDTWSNLEAAGFQYDSTYGFPDHPGFRNGMCYPFFPCYRNDEFSKVLEIPLVVMDASFIYYLKYDARETFECIKKLVDKTSKINGVLTLLWHNNYLYKPWKQIFLSVVRYCKDSGAWFATGEQLNDWWRQNDFCSHYSKFGLGRGRE